MCCGQSYFLCCKEHHNKPTSLSAFSVKTRFQDLRKDATYNRKTIHPFLRQANLIRRYSQEVVLGGLGKFSVEVYNEGWTQTGWQQHSELGHHEVRGPEATDLTYCIYWAEKVKHLWSTPLSRISADNLPTFT